MCHRHEHDPALQMNAEQIFRLVTSYNDRSIAGCLSEMLRAETRDVLISCYHVPEYVQEWCEEESNSKWYRSTIQGTLRENVRTLGVPEWQRSTSLKLQCSNVLEKV